MMCKYILVVCCVVGCAAGKEKPLSSDNIIWCWTSHGYGDYRQCADSLSDSDLSTTVDLSSPDGQPTWLMATFDSFVDLTGLRLQYTGDNDVQMTFIFSDGSMEQAPTAVEERTLGRAGLLQTEAVFPRRLTRSVTVYLSHSRPFTATAREILVYGYQHGNLRRVSDWEHKASCRYKGRDCGVMVDGFLDLQYFVGVGSSAFIYLNDTYDISHLTLLEAVPEHGASLYDKMSVTLGYPTGMYMKDKTYEFTLCPHNWEGSGSKWQQLTLPRATKARYVNITAIGQDEKVVNGFSELEIFASKGDVVYTQANLPCMRMKEVVPGQCECECPDQTCNCDTKYTTTPPSIPVVTDKISTDYINQANHSANKPKMEQVIATKGMSKETMFLFTLCGTAGIAVGCMIGWMATCIILCRERAAGSRKSSQGPHDSSQLKQHRKNQRTDSHGPHKNSSLGKMKEVEFASQNSSQDILEDATKA